MKISRSGSVIPSLNEESRNRFGLRAHGLEGLFAHIRARFFVRQWRTQNDGGGGGFTLIELLVVISVIGALMAFLFISYTGAQKQTRDTERRSQIAQYQASLEAFANVNNDYYPSYTTAAGERASVNLCQKLARVISGCPEDPRFSDESSQVYLYQSNGNGSGATDATQYVLWAKLEDTSNFWVVCSRGKKGTTASVSTTGGTCPI